MAGLALHHGVSIADTRQPFQTGHGRRPGTNRPVARPGRCLQCRNHCRHRLRLAAGRWRTCAQRCALHPAPAAGHCQRCQRLAGRCAPAPPDCARAGGQHGPHQTVPGHWRADAAGPHGGHRRASAGTGARHALRTRGGAWHGQRPRPLLALAGLPAVRARSQPAGLPAGAGRNGGGPEEPGRHRCHPRRGRRVHWACRFVRVHGPPGQPRAPPCAGRHPRRHHPHPARRQGSRHPGHHRSTGTPVAGGGCAVCGGGRRHHAAGQRGAGFAGALSHRRGGRTRSGLRATEDRKTPPAPFRTTFT